MGTIQWKKFAMDRIPVPEINTANQEPLKCLVDKIICIKKEDDYFTNSGKQKKVGNLEKDIDQLIYSIYDFSIEQIKLIEES